MSVHALLVKSKSKFTWSPAFETCLDCFSCVLSSSNKSANDRLATGRKCSSFAQWPLSNIQLLICIVRVLNAIDQQQLVFRWLQIMKKESELIREEMDRTNIFHSNVYSNTESRGKDEIKTYRQTLKSPDEIILPIFMLTRK